MCSHPDRPLPEGIVTSPWTAAPPPALLQAELSAAWAPLASLSPLGKPAPPLPGPRVFSLATVHTPPTWPSASPAPGSSPPLKPAPHLPSGGPHCHFPSRPVLHGMKLYITSISSAVTTTDHHKPGDLKRQEVLSGSWGWKVELRLPEGPLGGGSRPLPCGVPGGLDVPCCGHGASVPACIVTWPLPWLSVSKTPSQMDASHGIGAGCSSVTSLSLGMSAADPISK